jgi:hypothetical protein
MIFALPRAFLPFLLRMGLGLFSLRPLLERRAHVIMSLSLLQILGLWGIIFFSLSQFRYCSFSWFWFRDVPLWISERASYHRCESTIEKHERETNSQCVGSCPYPKQH